MSLKFVIFFVILIYYLKQLGDFTLKFVNFVIFWKAILASGDQLENFFC